MQLIHYGEYRQQLCPHLLAKSEKVCLITSEIDRCKGNKPPSRSKTTQKTTLTAMSPGSLKVTKNVVQLKYSMDTKSRTLREE
jgi:hypothetical protein